MPDLSLNFCVCRHSDVWHNDEGRGSCEYAQYSGKCDCQKFRSLIDAAEDSGKDATEGSATATNPVRESNG